MSPLRAATSSAKETMLRGGRVRDAIHRGRAGDEAARAESNVLDRENVEAARDCRDPDHLDLQGPERA